MTSSTHGRSQLQVTRRQFVRSTGVGLAGASLASMLAARQAPAQIKGTNLRILTWSHFIPPTTRGSTSSRATGARRMA